MVPIVNEICVTVNVSPSASESLSNTFPVAGVSSFTVTTLSLATGIMFTGSINIFTAPVSVEFPSLIVYEIVGTVPTKKSPGVPSLFVSLDGVKVKFPAASIVTDPTFGITTVPGLPGVTETVCPPTVNEVTEI